jgi:methylated-DNA-protein-cysteine methyltransferase-like protein
MVGWAMNASHNRDDSSTSRSEQKRIAYRKIPFDGTNLMQQLLESEGIVVVEIKL